MIGSSKVVEGDRVLFLTGKLAERALLRVLGELGQMPFTWRVHELGLSVAALMTADMIGRRLKDTGDATRIIVPGRCRGDLDALAARLGLPVDRGPEELKDLPQYFGTERPPADLSRHDCLIFAEIVDAPELDVSAIIARARSLREQGADVIDLGCMPETPFDHLEDAVRALKAEGHRVSVDSMKREDLRRGGLAGADYLLSLDERSVDLLAEVDSTPILVPSTPGDLASLERAIDVVENAGRAYFADPILDPIHFGFVDSILRYRELRARRPQAPMMMGVGNLTELTHADTAGTNALLFGMISELGVGAVLTTSVSGHARTAIREADLARRIMFAAREESALPRYQSGALMMLHERDPFPDSDEEIRDLASRVRDPNYRIQVGERGIYCFNRDGVQLETDPFAFYPRLAVQDDPGHAFYLGVELARAQIAWQLGKRFVQDQELEWGAALTAAPEDLSRHKDVGTTLSHAIRQAPAKGEPGPVK